MGIASAVDNVGETYKMYRKSGHGAIESVVDVGVDGIRNFIGIDDIYSGIVGEDRYGKQIGGFGNRLRVGGGGMFDLGISTTGVYGVARTAGSRTARGVGGLAKVAKVKIVNTGRRIAERMKTVANRPLPTRFDLYPPKTLVRSLDGTPVFSLTSKARMSQAQRLITDEEILEACFFNKGLCLGRAPGAKIKNK